MPTGASKAPHPSLSAETIAGAFRAACHQELVALKPGNVHVHAAGHGMEVRDFELSAQAAAPHIAKAGASVGARILGAVEATWASVATNTNLGIVLLCAPLAAAAERVASGETLRAALARVLRGLDRQDAADAFAAIARANPAGLGKAAEADVASPATVTLLQAMALAADRDRIAQAYVTDYADIFDFALPRFAAARIAAEQPDLAVTAVHMALLSTFPDSHIARKWGPAAAEAVRAEAAGLAPAWQPAVTTSGLHTLREFDASLKARRLNPGTTADFVVATLFTNSLQTQIARSVRA